MPARRQLRRAAQHELSGQGIGIAASHDPSPSPSPPAIGSDKADRGMADATPRGPAPGHVPDQPYGETPSAKNVATPPKETGVPRTDSRNHIENAKSLDTSIIEDPGGEDTAQAAEPKPGNMGGEKIACESKKVVGRKNAHTSDTPTKKEGIKGSQRKPRIRNRPMTLPIATVLTVRVRPGGVILLSEGEARMVTQRRRSNRRLFDGAEGLQTHLEGAIGRRKRRELEERKRGSGSSRSWGKRHSRSTNRASRDSLVSILRAADIFQNVPAGHKTRISETRPLVYGRPFRAPLIRPCL